MSSFLSKYPLRRETNNCAIRRCPYIPKWSPNRKGFNRIHRNARPRIVVLQVIMVLQVDSSRPTVQLVSQGKVIGITLAQDDAHFRPRAVDCFLGIPYAVPPVGDRRFRPAERLPYSPDNVHDASKYGPAAPGKQLVKPDPGAPDLVYSEDCLTANVFRLAGSARDGHLLPVAIYVHGGAFNRGTATMHNTASMVSWSAEPFIAVSFNYRIGALGFLPSSLCAEEGLLNLGLKDQILLFEWVKENAAAFGGDPDNITLFGLSAGAHSVSWTGTLSLLRHEPLLTFLTDRSPPAAL